MARLIWSPPPLRDVQRLYRFLAPKNAAAAQRAVKTIREGVKVLADRPAVGRPAQEMDPEYREWMIDFGSGGYIVLYHWDGSTAVILAVRHQREAGYW